MAPSVIESVGGLRAAVAGWRAEGLTVALVPTMGALHESLMALVRATRAYGGRTVVSLFVNPTQFAADEDFALYPRNPADDIARGTAALKAAGFARIDYLAVCDAETLEPVGRVEVSARVLAAAWLGETQLIDNVAAGPAG